MPYAKQTWTNGDVITEEKLNHMEDGIGVGDNVIVSITYDAEQGINLLNRTWREIKDYLLQGKTVYADISEEDEVSFYFYREIVVGALKMENQEDYRIITVITTSGSDQVVKRVYYAQAPDSYPYED